MQKNLYYRAVFKRENIATNIILSVFMIFAGYPRLLLEVFIRRNFGERYFNKFSVVLLALVLFFIPKAGIDVLPALAGIFGGSVYGAYHGRVPHDQSFWGSYTTWYLFLAAFLYFSFRRWQEIKRSPSIFNFGRFTLSSGDILPFFYKFLNLMEAIPEGLDFKSKLK